MFSLQKLAVLLLGTISATTASAQTQTFTTAGANTFTVPAGVLSMKVECVGGGGAGGRVTPSNFLDNDAAGGGGGGAFAMNYVPVTPGTVYNVLVGAGGTNDGSSVHGGNSSFDGGAQVLAEGGKTRTGNDEVAGAEGGKALNSIGLVKYNGGNGGLANEGDSDGGGGGGAAGTGGNGYDGSTVTGGGNRATYGGFGGNGGDDGANGVAGGNYGGGGGGSSANGSTDRNGGAGASGIVVLSWCTVTGFAPASVCALGEVVLTGTHFTGVDSVFINGISVPFIANSETQITITVPAGATSGPVVVSTAYGRSRTISSLTVAAHGVSISSTGMQLTAQYSGGSGATYQWINCVQGNAPISGAQSSTYTAPQYGLYAISVTESGCTVTSSCFLLNSTSGIDEMSSELAVALFPNPASGFCTIVSEKEPVSAIQVTDLNGKAVLTLDVNAQEVAVELTSLQSGCYLVKIVSGTLFTTKRLIIQN